MSDEGDVPQRTDELLALLVRAGIEHVVIGGVAAIAWGGAELTRDLDIVMPFDVEHVARLMPAQAASRSRGTPTSW